MDVFTKEQRSKVMRSVKSSSNKSTEMELIRLFKANHIKGWRRNYKVFGRPDFVFIKTKLAIFVDGCFWHGHNCRNITPSSNKEYWQKKINKNKERDRNVNSHLSKQGWHVERIWECSLKKQSSEVIGKIKRLISSKANEKSG